MTTRVLPVLLLVCLLTTAVVEATPLQYSPSDWVSYTDLRYISSIAVSPRFVYMGTTQGIAVFDRAKGKWTDPITTGDGLPEANVEVVAIDRYTDRLLASSGTKIYSMERETETWRSYSVEGIEDRFTSVGADLDHIWAEGSNVKIRFDKMTGGWHVMNEVPKEIEWFGERGGVDIGEPEYSFLAPFYVLGEDLERYDYTCAVKSEGSLWLGTWGYGAYEYNLLSRWGKHSLMGIAGGRTDAISLDGETFWFGSAWSEAPGITSWESKKDIWTYYSEESEFGILSNRVSSMAFDSEYVYIGTEDGLTRFQKKDSSFKTYTLFNGLPASEVTAVHVAEDSLWIGTSLGPCVTGRSSWSLTKFDELRVWVNDLLLVDDTMWVATEDGVFLLDILSGKWSELEYPEGLVGLSTYALLADTGKIWFGTWRGALCLDRRSGRWERFTSPVHLPSERVTALAADDKNVWVGTDSGAAQFIKGRADWERYGPDDGLIGERVSGILCAGDHVYFSTEKGVTRFYWANPFTAK